MDLRSASREVVWKELKPFLLQAIKVHPNPVDVKVVRGNIVTARDYARRFLISVRKNGVDKMNADSFRAIKPPIRVYLNSAGITFAGLAQKRTERNHWDSYKTPFKVLPVEDARWTTLAINPTESEIKSLGLLLVKGVLPSPLELRTHLTVAALKALAPNIHVFRLGKNTIFWPLKKEAA